MKIMFLLFLISTVHIFCYEASLSRTLAQFSAIAYQSTDLIKTWSCNRCKKYQVEAQQSFNIGANEIQGFMSYLSSMKALIVAFRGSVNIKNWITNLSIIMGVYKQCEECKVHSGFYDAYRRSKSELHRLISNLLNKYDSSVDIIITGHSMGGALAVFGGLDMKKFLNRTIKLYTYGQPRVGNEKFAQFLSANIPEYYRIVYNNDLAVHFPSKLFGFEHGGRQIWYRSPDMKNYKQCQGDSQECSNSVPFWKLSFKQHDISNYVKISSEDKSLLHLLSDKIQDIFASYLRSDITETQGIIINFQTHQKILSELNKLHI